MFQAHQQRNKQWPQGQSVKLGAVKAVPVKPRGGFFFTL